MKLKVMLGFTVAFFAGVAGAYDDPYQIKVDPYGVGSYGGSTDIQMKQRNNYDPSAKYRGQIENDGSVRMRNSNGDTLRGHIEEDGYGKLRDQDGNVYKVKPR